jgi:Bacterial Ig-like domain/S-layer homology domain
VFVRIINYYANGNPVAYTVRPTFVDTVAPVAKVAAPAANATDVSQWIAPVATFNEPVLGVSSATVRLRDMETLRVVPATVRYDSARREVRLTPTTRLAGHHPYRFELTPGIRDLGGNPVASTRVRFKTSLYAFRDIQGTAYAGAIQWLAARAIVPGCGSERFCPTTNANRTMTAVVLDRALDLPATARDHFTDDNGRKHEDAINRVGAAGLITACGPAKFCPRNHLRRGEVAAILARAFDPPATDQDFFTDDDGAAFEDAVNRVAAAGLMDGCGTTTFCPGRFVRRQELADAVHRALTD